MMKRRWLMPNLLAGAAMAASPAVQAEEANTAPVTRAEFQKLQSDVKEQRQFLIQLIQTEQQRFDMLLKLMASNGSLAALEKAQVPSPPQAPADHDRRPAARQNDDGPGAGTGTLEGKVNVPGGDVSDIYVYVENVRTAPAKGKVVEIKQENKQFIPRLAVVQVGTTVAFPNLDPVFHNVFSNSPSNVFDLGTYRAGDKSRSVVMNKPGVVDVYCNMHQRMSANVLVVPSRLYAKVRPDGTFRIENVPVGVRSVVAWSPTHKPMAQKVDVSAEGGRATFALEYSDKKAHANKFGQPYGSYKE